MTMPEKKPMKATFTEQDAATLTKRYDAATVLTLLQEVEEYADAKIDWNELVKKTSTGISNAREYQMLWRHLAYGDSLFGSLEDGAEPLDDGSDLECELELSAPVSAESASEAAACVKVMIASHALHESTPSSSTIDAPLTINIPACHSSSTPNGSSQPSNSMQGTNINFPVTVQRQTLPNASSTDVIETKGLRGGNMASKRRRQAWSEEEDILLRDAVERYGERNWATMAKGDDFPIKRSATQLAQRWSILRKKDGSTHSGTNLTSTPHTTAEQLATRHSLSLALDMPFKKLTAPGMTDPARTSLNLSSKNKVQNNTTEASKIQGSVASGQQPVSKVNSTPLPVVKATAVALGARVISPSESASQFKVAFARDVPTTNSSLTKSSTLTSLPSDSKAPLFTSSSVATLPTQPGVAIASPISCTSVIKAASSTTGNSTSRFSLHEQDKHVASGVNKVTMKQESDPMDVFRGSDPSPAPKEIVQKDDKLIQEGSMNIPLKEGTAPVATHSNMDKGSQEKVKTSINGSSKDQNMKES